LCSHFPWRVRVRVGIKVRTRLGLVVVAGRYSPFTQHLSRDLLEDVSLGFQPLSHVDAALPRESQVLVRKSTGGQSDVALNVEK
jgi:hypothetical protein